MQVGRPLEPPGGGGFTLIELLIVVAIIAVLAAIALPNFLEAQTRAKVSREKSELRTLGTALEAYRVDAAHYPPHGEILADGTYDYPASKAGLGTVEYTPGWPLTTPVAYLSALPEDPLLRLSPSPTDHAYGYIQSEQMSAILLSKGSSFTFSAEQIGPTYGGWRLYAAGPDGDKGADAKTAVFYDPTNGTVSDGDVVRSQVEPEENDNEDK